MTNDRNGECAGIVYITIEAAVLPQHISTQNAQHIALMLLRLPWAGLLQQRLAVLKLPNGHPPPSGPLKHDDVKAIMEDAFSNEDGVNFSLLTQYRPRVVTAPAFINCTRAGDIWTNCKAEVGKIAFNKYEMVSKSYRRVYFHI